MKRSPDFNAYRGLLKTIRIPHPAYALAITELERAYDTVGHTDFPQCRQLKGPSRGGKTCVIKDFMAHAPASRRTDGLQCPIVYAHIPPKGTTMGLIENLLNALGDPHWARGSESNKLSRLILQLTACGCRMIVLDEFQHLADKGQNKTLKRTVDFIKALVDPNQWALVASGLPEASRVIDLDPQLRGRFDAPLDMPRFDWTDGVLHEQFRGVLIAFEEAIAPFDIPPLDSEEMALRFYLATGGLIGLVAKLLQRAIHDAIADKRFTIALHHLNAAFRQAIRFSTQVAVGDGPFEIKLLGISLDERLSQIVRMATVSEYVDEAESSVIELAPARTRKQRTVADHKREMAEAL